MKDELQQETQKVKNELKIILISLASSFLYMILALIEFIFTYPFNDHTHHPILWTEWIAMYILVDLPIALILFWVVPKLRAKIKIRKYIFYLTLFSWIFVFVYLHIFRLIYNLKVQ